APLLIYKDSRPSGRLLAPFAFFHAGSTVSAFCFTPSGPALPLHIPSTRPKPHIRCCCPLKCCLPLSWAGLIAGPSGLPGSRWYVLYPEAIRKFSREAIIRPLTPL